MRVDPATAFCRHPMAIAGQIAIAHRFGHLFHGSQCGEIPCAAHGIGAVELPVTGVVLNAIHNAGFVFIPPSWPPCISQSSLGCGPLPAQPVVVAKRYPVKVKLDALSHLAIRSSGPRMLIAKREFVAEIHVAFGVGRVAETYLTHGARERGKKKLRHCFIVPNMRTAAVGETDLVPAAFEAMKAAVTNAKARIRDKGA